MTDTVAAPPEIDPRIERTRCRVLDAVDDLLGEVGFGELNVEAIAARSGVAKSTIYRHWPAGKLALVEDACLRYKATDVVPPPGPVLERVLALVVPLAARLADPRVSSGIVALIEAAERNPEVRAVQTRLAGMGIDAARQVLLDAVQSGELPADTDVERLIDLTSGYLFMRRIGRWNPVPPADVPDVVRFLLIAAGWRDPRSSQAITSKETPHA